MKRPEKIDQVLGNILHSTPQQEMDAAGVRVLQRLRAESQEGADGIACEPATLRRLRLVAAFAVILAAVTSAAILRHRIFSRNSGAIVENAGGGLFRVSADKTVDVAAGEAIHYGETVRTDGGDSATVTLPDASRIEMRAKSEFALEHVDDGIRIRLRRGSIIVNAAKQRTGHLYVQTKDVTVSVVGTVFLVNAEEAGSRVAVIQGEVSVQQAGASKQLLPGEQTATSPRIQLPSLVEEFSWSRNVEAHLALLQQSTATTARPARLEFAVASIRPSEFRNGGGIPNGISLGFACHGTDGGARAPFGGGGPPVVAPQGRCIGGAVSFAQLMNFAFVSPWRYGPGAPDWARADPDNINGANPNEQFFQIDAVAEDPAGATLAQLRQMLQAMLSDRFKLRIHRERQEVQAYALRVVKDGLKIKQVPGELEQPEFQGLGVLKGRSSLDEFARFLTEFMVGFVNLGYLDTPIINRTGLTGIYEYEFRLRPRPGGGVRGGDTPVAGPPSRAVRAADQVASWSANMEEQLGLHIQPEKATYELIIVDQVERPSPN
jgi:uncharacterized protein (TIGR03435 family)